MKQRRFLVSIAIVLSLAMVPALATADGFGSGGGGSTCVLTYVRCLNAAANLPTWWERSAAGLDCFVDMAICIERSRRQAGGGW